MINGFKDFTNHSLLDSAVQEVRRASRAATFLLIIIYLSNLFLEINGLVYKIWKK